MTKEAQQEAYLRGFCKVAVAHGVEPEALLKYAQGGLKGLGAFAWKALKGAPKRLWYAAKHPVYGVKRFGELLAGGKSGLTGAAAASEAEKALATQLGTAGGLSGLLGYGTYKNIKQMKQDRDTLDRVRNLLDKK